MKAEESIIKKARVQQLANDTLEMLGLDVRVKNNDVEITSCDDSVYGVSEIKTFEGIKIIAQSEGLIVGPVYEGNAIRGLRELSEKCRFE